MLIFSIEDSLIAYSIYFDTCSYDEIITLEFETYMCLLIVLLEEPLDTFTNTK